MFGVMVTCLSIGYRATFILVKQNTKRNYAGQIQRIDYEQRFRHLLRDRNLRESSTFVDWARIANDIIQPSTDKEELVKDFEKLVESMEHGDVTFNVQGQRLEAHKKHFDRQKPNIKITQKQIWTIISQVLPLFHIDQSNHNVLLHSK